MGGSSFRPCINASFLMMQVSITAIFMRGRATLALLLRCYGEGAGGWGRKKRASAMEYRTSLTVFDINDTCGGCPVALIGNRFKPVLSSARSTGQAQAEFPQGEKGSVAMFYNAILQQISGDSPSRRYMACPVLVDSLPPSVYPPQSPHSNGGKLVSTLHQREFSDDASVDNCYFHARTRYVSSPSPLLRGRGRGMG